MIQFFELSKNFQILFVSIFQYNVLCQWHNDLRSVKTFKNYIIVSLDNVVASHSFATDLEGENQHLSHLSRGVRGL